MKKLYSILALLLIAFTFGGCTLSMEEWLDDPSAGEVPEELRGVDEPYTYNIPGVITATYKYNPGVKPVTTKSKSYLAYVENDTILYFYDNMPKELVPVAGEYLATGCSPELPDGLNNLVVEVTRTGGLYRVHTSRATIDEVYDQLVYEVDVTYNPPIGDILAMDSIPADSAGNIAEIEDWSLIYEHDESSRNKIKKLSRAEASPKDTTTSWDFKYTWEYSPGGNTGGKEAWDKLFNGLIFNYVNNNRSLIPGFEKAFYFELSYLNETKVRGYSMVNKEEKYEKTYTETTETHKLGVAVGMNYGNKFDLVDPKEEYKPLKVKDLSALKEGIKALKQGSKMDKAKGALYDLPFKLRLPGVVPTAFVFKFSITANVTFNGNIGAYVETSSTVHEGYIYDKGKKSPIKEKVTNNPKWSVVGSGSASFGFVASVSGGVMVAETAGADIGLDGTLTILEVKAEGGYDSSLDGKLFINASVGSSLNVNPFVNFYVSPFGWDLWNNKLTLGTGWSIFNTSASIDPTLKIEEVPGSLEMGENDNPVIDYNYFVSDIGIGLDNKKYQPKVAIYVNDINENNLLGYGEQYPSDKPFEKYTYYIFKYDFEKNGKEYNPSKKYIAVPALYNPDSKEYLYYTNHGYVLKTATPNVDIVGGAQEEAADVFDDFNFSDVADNIKYRFAVDVETSYISSAYDFGISVSIPELGVKDKQISLKRTIFGNGIYTISLVFHSNYASENLKVEVKSYTVDGFTGEIKYSDYSEEINMNYPQEYVQHYNPMSKRREDVDFE